MKESVPCTASVNRDSDKYVGDVFQVTIPKFIRKDEKIKRCGHDWQLSDRQSNRIRHEYVSTWLFKITWQISQNRYTWMAERTCTCDPHKARETLQVYLDTPREFIFVGDRQELSENGGDGSTGGAVSLATKIAWPKAMRVFFNGDTLRAVFLPPLPQDLLRRRIIVAISEINRDMLQRVWAEMDYRLDVCRVAKDGHTDLFWSKKKKRKKLESFSPTVVRMLQSLPPLVYVFYEMCRGRHNLHSHT